MFEKNKLLNSIILTYSDGYAAFSTCWLSSNDDVNNVLTYNYNTDNTLNIMNYVHPNCLENTDPILSDVILTEREFNVELLVQKTFAPELNSPVFNAGNNEYVSDISTDIIGNGRIFNNQVVDIGPYELQAHILDFGFNNIQAIYQDKLTLSEDDKMFI